MVRLNWFQRFYWERLAYPHTDRELHRVLVSRSVQSLIEIGIGNGERMRRIARLLRIANPALQLRYVGVDAFESANDGQSHLTLKQSHQIAVQLGYRATLVPGDASTALPRVAHKIGFSDLVVINGGLDLSQPTSGPIGKWLYHIAHEQSIILACHRPNEKLQRVVMAPAPASRAA